MTECLLIERNLLILEKSQRFYWIEKNTIFVLIFFFILYSLLWTYWFCTLWPYTLRHKVGRELPKLDIITYPKCFLLSNVDISIGFICYSVKCLNHNDRKKLLLISMTQPRNQNSIHSKHFIGFLWNLHVKIDRSFIIYINWNLKAKTSNQNPVGWQEDIKSQSN